MFFLTNRDSHAFPEFSNDLERVRQFFVTTLIIDRTPGYHLEVPVNPLPAEAYEALADALAKIFWHKKAFERYIHLILRDRPELIAGLPFSETKRLVANELVNRLARKEGKYRDFTLSLMREVAAMQDFPNVVSVRDRPELLSAAQDAVARLGRISRPLVADHEAAEKMRNEAQQRRAKAQSMQREALQLTELRQEFLGLGGASGPQQRGRDFERFLDRLFVMFDLAPRTGYNVDADQIDGAISFDSDDYIIEAKWLAKPVERHYADSFAKKVERSGKNGLGLFISASGFSSGFIQTFSRSTPFITIDGVDLFAVLDGRFRLDDLLRAKKRHANETGSCFLPVSSLIS
ncbi:restriction endonuclease [Paenarthrobacter sp. NPDC058040]|uniref:restriction endonuclease n=1 Tax=Paenarthrobacter sp. NPDC058040 TaxID=3346309 RepID=UPI0036DDF5B9